MSNGARIESSSRSNDEALRNGKGTVRARRLAYLHHHSKPLADGRYPGEPRDISEAESRKFRATVDERVIRIRAFLGLKPGDPLP